MSRPRTGGRGKTRKTVARDGDDVIALMAALSEDDRRALVRRLGAPVKRELCERWEGGWARPGQLPPEGDWRTWLIRAGRGFGKTRSGAEWVTAIAAADGEAQIALVGATAADVRRVEETSAECRADLGDARCRVPLAGRRRFARVLAVEGATLTLDAAEPVAGAYAGGSLRWFGGANAGLAQAIDASEDARVHLRGEPAFAVAPGALVECIEGCDKRFATCVARFGNAANFRGEPHLPGMDLLTRYPGG